jgi:hypothetical protein
MGLFFVNTDDGRIATQTQLMDASLTDWRGKPEPPWHEIRGPSDASTMWYAVLRKRERGISIGALCFRHAPRFASLTATGWEEVPPDRIGVDGDPATLDRR